MARGSTRTRRDGRFAIALLIALLIALVAGLLPEAAAVAAATPTPSASWNFDDGSGSTADDGVGNRNGTLVGDATWSALDPHQGTGSVSLPSADGRVVIPSNATLEPATSLAFSVWIRTTATDGILVEKGDAGCSLPAWQLGMYGGAVGFQWRTPTTSGSRGSPQDSRINDGAWHHVALSMVISTGVATLYVDGRTSQNGTGPAPGIDYAASDQTTSDLIIGSLNSCPTLPAGAIADYDDLRFYSTSLAASDVWAMEPSFATTTSVQMTPAVPAPGEITSFFARVTPYPPNAGTITFHYTVDGGADHAIPKDISEVGTALLEFGYPNALPVGHYVFWAEFDGVGPAEASSSNSFDFTIAAYATTTVGHVDGSQPIPIQQSFTLIVSTRYDTDQPGRRPTGTFAFYDVSGAEPVEIGTYGGCNSASAAGECLGILQIPGRPIGTYRFRGHFTGSTFDSPSDTADIEVVVAKSPVALTLSPNPDPIQANHPGFLTAQVHLFQSIPIGGSGVLSIRDVATDVILASGLPGDGMVQAELDHVTTGTHDYEVDWTGNDVIEASSKVFSITVVPDVVQATGIGLNATTFYPVVDGYRDTVTAFGTRVEPISVAISVRNSGGSLVRKGTVASGVGKYFWAWNGKNAAGTLMPAGTYRITQVLKDAAGTTLTVTKSVTLSRKRLYWYSADIYKTPSQAQKKTSSWAAWLFTMPSATSYRSLTLYVYGKRAVGSNGVFGPQDFRYCALSSIGPNCVQRHQMLDTTTRWVSITVSPTYERSGRYVRGYVQALWGTISVGKLRLHLQYGILK